MRRTSPAFLIALGVLTAANVFGIELHADLPVATALLALATRTMWADLI